MSDNGGSRFTFTQKFGPNLTSMVVIRADDPEELSAWTNVAEQVAPALQDLGKVYLPPKTTEEAIQNLQDGGITGEVYDGKTCMHGAMTYKTGGYGAKQWAAWMCPAPQGDPSKCQPIDAKTGKPWPKR